MTYKQCIHCRTTYHGDAPMCGPCRRKGHKITLCPICFGTQAEGKDPLVNIDVLVAAQNKVKGKDQ